MQPRSWREVGFCFRQHDFEVGKPTLSLDRDGSDLIELGYDPLQRDQGVNANEDFGLASPPST